MKLLAIETSSAEGSVALASGDALLERVIPTPREQTALVLPFIDALLNEAELTLDGLDALVYGRGPGSFTGLRVAAAVAQGLALASGRPLVGVSSLAAAAQRAWSDCGIDCVLVCVDARMGDVYSGRYRVRDELAAAIDDETIGKPATVAPPDCDRYLAIGDALETYASEMAAIRQASAEFRPDIRPRARDLLPQARVEVAAGRFLEPKDALPVYLRQASAWKRR